MAAPTCDDDAVETENKIKENEITKLADKSLLDQFYKLSEISQVIRIDGVSCIIRILQEKQQAFATTENQNARCPDLEYTIERLVRGLASSWKVARQGFCLALIEVLRLFHQVEIEDIIKYAEKHLSAKTTQDKSVASIAQFLTYSAVIQSERLKTDPYMSFVVINVLKFSEGKSYLQNGTYKVITSLFTQITQEQFKQSVWPILKEKLQFGWEKSTADDTLWLLLLVSRFFPKTVSSKFLKKFWGNEDLFADDNMKYWKDIVKQSTSVHPNFHPVCSEILEFCFSNSILKNVWKFIIDENLFETDQNEKTSLGFCFVRETLLKTLKKNIVSCVLSSKFTSSLCRSLLNSKHPLHNSANEMMAFLCGILKEKANANVQIIILKALLQLPNFKNLEQILKKKEITSMISYLQSDAVKTFYEILKSVVLKKNDAKCKIDDSKRCLALSQIGALVSHPTVFNDLEWRSNVIKFLFLHSYFVVDQPNTEFSEETTDWFSIPVRDAFKTSLNKAMDSFNRRTGSNLQNQINPMQIFSQFLISVVEYADSLLQATDSLSPLFSLESFNEAWTQMKAMIKKLGKYIKKDKKTCESYAFRILFLQLGLHLFQDTENIASVLDELQICCKNALKLQHDDEDIADNAENLPWDQVLLDILLSLLSQPSHHMRCVVTSVFSNICTFLSSEALQLIFDAINPEKQTENDENDENEAEFESGSSSESEQEDEDEKNNFNANLEFKMKLQKVLGSTGDASEEEASDDEVSDSEMFKLDDALSQLFQERKKKLSPEERNLLHFKLKCLDLIQIYLKSEPALNLALQCIKPLLTAYDLGKPDSFMKPLSEKALTTLTYFGKVKKFQHEDNVEKTQLEKLLDFLLAKAVKESNSNVGNILYTLCVFVMLCEKRSLAKKKVSDGTSLKKMKSKCLKKYLVLLESFVKQSNCHIKPSLFVKLINACPEYAWHFLEPLEEHAFNENIRLHKKSQCLGLILSALKYSKKQDSIPSEKWLDFCSRVTSKLVEALRTVKENTDIKPVYTTEILDLIVTMESIMKEKQNVSIIDKHPDLKELLQGFDETQNKKLLKKGRQLKRKIICLLGGEDDAPNSKKKQKQIKNKQEEIIEIPSTNGHMSTSDESYIEAIDS